jgi:hypothetical protein
MTFFEPIQVAPISIFGAMLISYIAGYYVGAVRVSQKIQELIEEESKRVK